MTWWEKLLVIAFSTAALAGCSSEKCNYKTIFAPDGNPPVPYPSNVLLEKSGGELAPPAGAGLVFPKNYKVNADGFSPESEPLFSLEGYPYEFIKTLESTPPEASTEPYAPFFLINTSLWRRVPAQVEVLTKTELGFRIPQTVVVIKPLQALDFSTTYIAGLVKNGENEICPADVDRETHELLGKAEGKGLIQGDVLIATSFKVRSRENAGAMLFAITRSSPSLTRAEFTSEITCTKAGVPSEECREEISGGKIIRGYFQSPAYVPADNPLAHGKWENGSDPISYPTPQSVPFLAVIPQGAEGTVVFQHGFGDSKNAMFRELAYTFSLSGLAVIGIDLPYHGERAIREIHLDFIGIKDESPYFDITLFRDHMLQALLDHWALFNLIRNSDGDLNGDGNPDIPASPLYYLGQSLGGIIGGTSAFLNAPQRAVLNVSGGNLSILFEHFLSFLFIAAPAIGTDSPLERYLIFNYSGLILDPVEPANWLREAHSHILMQMAMKDILVPAESTYFLARTADIPLVEPVVSPAPFMPITTPPASQGLIQYENATHGFILTINENEPWQKAQQQSACFLKTGIIGCAR